VFRNDSILTSEGLCLKLDNGGRVSTMHELFSKMLLFRESDTNVHILTSKKILVDSKKITISVISIGSSEFCGNNCNWQVFLFVYFNQDIFTSCLNEQWIRRGFSHKFSVRSIKQLFPKRKESMIWVELMSFREGYEERAIEHSKSLDENSTAKNGDEDTTEANYYTEETWLGYVFEFTIDKGLRPIALNLPIYRKTNGKSFYNKTGPDSLTAQIDVNFPNPQKMTIQRRTKQLFDDQKKYLGSYQITF
jgi:hypothetical protein